MAEKMLPSTSFRTALLQWYRRHHRNLPWRRTRDPYRIFVSEVMLQQTRAATVAPYYERFLKAFPTVRHLARAPRDRLMKLWEGLGYYARARNLHAAAEKITGDFGGKIPRDPEIFSKLPGAGPYTTAAVLSIAFDAPLAAVDGNVKRVIARLFDIDRPILPKDGEIISLAQKLIDSKHAGHGRPSAERDRDVQRSAAGDFNQAMMELGARVCTPRGPACLLCPVRKFCRSYERGTVDARPVAGPRKARPHLRVVAGVLKKNGRVLVGRRPDRGLLGGLWEFPGGKVEPGESPEEALRRELREELGVEVEVEKSAAKVEHAYTHFSITLSGHVCRLLRGKPIPKIHSKLRWVSRKDLSSLAMPEANRKLLRNLSGKNIY